MREIKFRAWGYGKMFKPTTIEHMCGCMPRMNLTNLTLMQYTGLKDKNSVEIYEGDIVKFFDIPYGQDNVDFIEDIRVVKFENGRFHGADKCWRDFKNSGEVIGNIYENPELLESEDNR